MGKSHWIMLVILPELLLFYVMSHHDIGPVFKGRRKGLF